MKFIKYKIMQETNIGTEEEPNIRKELRDVSLGPMSDVAFEANYAMAVAEAYNGEVTVEEVEDEPAEPTQLDRVEAQVTYTAMMTDTLLEE